MVINGSAFIYLAFSLVVFTYTFCEIFLCVICFVCVFRYESVIATLCENLDSLDEPEARAAMIWIVGEYAERIDNADELLESFLEGFHDESTQVCLGVVLFCFVRFIKFLFLFTATVLTKASKTSGHICSCEHTARQVDIN